MHAVALEVADEFLEHVRDLYSAQHIRNQETNGVMPNVVLAGLTIAWLEAVHASWGKAYGESAVSLMREVAPKGKGMHTEMKRAARDFLRRSRWWIRSHR
jgi:hypothetical protein